jgi:hypothetical protein
MGSSFYDLASARAWSRAAMKGAASPVSAHRGHAQPASPARK